MHLLINCLKSRTILIKKMTFSLLREKKIAITMRLNYNNPCTGFFRQDVKITMNETIVDMNYSELPRPDGRSFVRTDTLAGGFFSPGDSHTHYPLSPQGFRDYLSFSSTSCRFSGRLPSVIPHLR